MRDLEWSMSEAAASMASSSLLAGGAFRSLSSPPRAGGMATASEGAQSARRRGRPNPESAREAGCVWGGGSRLRRGIGRGRRPRVGDG